MHLKNVCASDSKAILSNIEYKVEKVKNKLCHKI